MKDEQSHSASTQETGTAPSLWNPIALANWSLLLTPLFGSYLVAENYKAMGKPKEGEEAMVWFYVGIAIFLSVLFLLLSLGLFGFGVAMLIYPVYLVSWNFKSARKQNRAVLSEYGETYERQPWGKALAIGIAALIMWWIIISVFSSNVTSSLFPTTSFDSAEVKQVKSGVMQLCPSHTVDQMVKGFMGSPSWKSGKSADGKVFVNVAGDITFQDKPVRAMVQFIVEGESFSFSAFEMNGVPSANLIAIGLLNKMCASAEGSVAEKTAGKAPVAKNSEVTPQPQQAAPQIDESKSPTVNAAPVENEQSSSEAAVLNRYKASFDCSKASTYGEKITCSNPVLNQLDGLLAATYKERMSNPAFGVDKATFKASQLAWNKTKNECVEATCLEKAYRSRIEELCGMPVVSGAHPMDDCEAIQN